MSWRSKAGTVLSAGRGLGTWIAQNPLLTVIIAVALWLVLGNSGAAFSKGRQVAGYLKMLAGAGERIEALQREIAAKDKAWERREADQRERAETAEKVLAAAKGRLDAARAARKMPWSPPGDAMDLARRFEAAGFKGRVK